MELPIIESLISTVGFPTAVCVALFWLNRETVKHYERVLLEFKKSLDTNTESMNSLCNRIKRGDDV